MKKLLATIVATIVGVFVFLRLFKSTPQLIKNPKIKELDAEAAKTAEDIKKLEAIYGKPVEDKTLQDELDYWKKK